MPPAPARPGPSSSFIGPFAFWDACRGGPHGTAAQRAVAAEVERRWPGTRDQVRAADAFHVRQALRAVTGYIGGADWPPARGLVYAPAGFWPEYDGARWPHEAAALAAPRSRHLYANADRHLVQVWQQELRRRRPGPRVMAAQSRAGDPRQGAGMARAAGLEGPWSVQLQACAHWWPPDVARLTVAMWADVLPPGSSLVLSVPVPGGVDARGEFGALVATVVPVAPYPHSAEDVASWIEGAGLVLAPSGVRDVRVMPGPALAGEDLAGNLAGHVVGAIGLKPR